MIVFKEPVSCLGLHIKEVTLLTDHMAQLTDIEGKVFHIGVKNRPNLYSPVIAELKRNERLD